MHKLSSADRAFVADFQACRYAAQDFGHRAHVRLAYAYLVDHEPDAAVAAMREALLAFLRHNDIAVSKYHETLTRSWILAVRHFMARSSACASADEFIAANPELLDPKIMLTHYSADVLFSDRARAAFVEPDLSRIPRHDVADA